MTPADAVAELFRRVPEARDSCCIDGIEMAAQPFIVFASLANFVSMEVRAGHAGLDCPVDRVGALVEELVAGAEAVELVRFAFLPGLKTELGSVAADLACLGPRTRELFRQGRPDLWTP